MKRVLLAFVALWAVGGLPAEAASPQVTQTTGAFASSEGRPQVESHLTVRRAAGAALLDFSQSAVTDGKLVTRYDVEQTKLMHLIVVRDDFKGFMHVHPVLKDGHFSIAVPLAASHRYYAYADTTPTGLSKQVFRFAIGRTAAAVAAFSAQSVATVDGYQTRLSTAELAAGRATTIDATITRSGNVVTGLRPYLGAAGHAVLVNLRSLEYIHVHPTVGTGEHPMDAMETSVPPSFDGRMKLMLPALNAGTYRLWLQFQAPSGLIVTPLTLIVTQRSLAAMLIEGTGRGLFLAAGMLWQVGWSLALGFLLSGLVQTIASKSGMRAKLGRNGLREIALAAFYGAVSSSCSFAAAAMSKTLFKKGAGFIPSLAFLFSSTNLVIELGLILLSLMGWQFAAAEWIGGVVLIVIMAALVKLTYPATLIEQARAHLDADGGRDNDDDVVDGSSVWQKLRNPETLVLASQNAVMDFSMLWKDLAIGFLIAGALGSFVPDEAWSRIFLSGAPSWIQVPVDAVAGAAIAVLTFVCSIGNVPMAAMLWGSGLSFAGVLTFLYADLIVVPLLDIYRKYYGWRMAAYIGAVFFVTMVAAGIIMNAAFGFFHAIPPRIMTMNDPAALFRINYTFWLNIAFGAIALYAWHVSSKSGAAKHCCA